MSRTEPKRLSLSLDRLEDRTNPSGAIIPQSVVPALDSTVVGDAPTVFSFDTLLPAEPATVDPEDLTVNGVPADAVELSPDGESFTFTFDESPAFQGAGNRIEVAAGAFECLDDAFILPAFSSEFAYDAVLITPVAFSPAGGTVGEPPATVVVDFNEPFDPDGVSVNNASLVGLGQVAGAVTVIDADTLEFTFDLPLEEGPVGVSAGSLLPDAFGNPGTVGTADYDVEFDTAALRPAVSAGPLGSLVYDTAAAGAITSGDADSFTLDVDAGQTVAVEVTSADAAAGAFPKVELFESGPGGLTLIAEATPAADGEPAILQPTQVGGPLLTGDATSYVIRVSGEGGPSALTP